MPSRWAVDLTGPEPSEVRWEHLHAVVSAWFDDGAEHHDPIKGYSVSPPVAGPSGPVIEIGVVRDDLVPRFLSRAASGSPVRLGRTVSRIAAAPRQLAAIPWPQLGTGHRDRAWDLRFVSPMTFRRGNRFTPFPGPSPILGSLRRSWNTFAPSGQGVTLDLATDPVWVTDIHGGNEVRTINNRTVSGFVGHLRLECDGHDDVGAAINRLLALAPFAGIGAYTTRCFGTTRLERTRQPRWDR